jgi:uncharacterized membrane protein (DUF106 family)
MTNEERRFFTETIAEMKELKEGMYEFKGEMREFKGEMKEFKEHFVGRVEKLEKKESERGKVRLSLVSVLIATGALAVSIIINFFKG